MGVRSGPFRSILVFVLACAAGAACADQGGGASAPLPHPLSGGVAADPGIPALVRVGLPHPRSVRGLLQFDDSNAVDGFARQVVERALEASNVRAEFVALGAERIGHEALRDGDIDLLCVMELHAPNLHGLTVVEPFFVARGGAFFADGNHLAERALNPSAGLKGLRVLVPRNGYAFRWAATQGLPATEARTIRDGLQQVKLGQADVLVTELLAGNRVIEEIGATGVTPAELDGVGFANEYGAVVRQEQVALRAALMKGFERIRSDGTLTELRRVHTDRYQPTNRAIEVSVTAVAITASAVAAFGIATSIYLGITRRRLKQKSTALAASESRARLMVATLPAAIYSYHVAWDGTRTVIHQSPRLEEWQSRFPGFAQERPFEETIGPRMHPDDLPGYSAAVKTCRETCSRFDLIFRMRDSQERYRTLHTICEPRRRSDGIEWLAMTVDITEHRDLAAAAQRAEARFQAVVQSAPQTAIQIYDGEGRVVFWNHASEMLFGYSAADAVGKTLDQLILTSEEGAAFRSAIESIKQTGHAIGPNADMIRRKDGSPAWLISNLAGVPGPDGELQFVCIDTDISAFKRVSAELDQASDKLEAALSAAEMSTWLYDPSTQLVEADTRFFALFGMGVIENGVAPVDAVFSRIHPGDVEAVQAAASFAIQHESSYQIEYRLLPDASGSRWVSARGLIRTDPKSGRRVLAGTCCDITELRNERDERDRLSERLNQALEASGVGTWAIDVREGTVTADEAGIRLMGLAGIAEPHTRLPLGGVALRNIHPDDLDAFIAARDASISGRGAYACEFRVVVDGEHRWLSSRGQFYPGTGGRADRVVGATVDITESKRSAAERERLVLAIERGKRLESLGLLAGGVAHDFNNILAAIAGNAALASGQLPDGHPARSHLGAIEANAHHAAEVTAQLLATAGQSQVQAKPVCIETLVRESIPIAVSGLHAARPISLELASPTSTVLGDRGQLRQAVLNLLVNAAEATKDGGEIKVRIYNTQIGEKDQTRASFSKPIKPGPYLVLEVADTGIGMDEATLQNIFERFFSTKNSGRGLGLAVVAGTVHSHDGAVEVTSAPGRGATFRAFLPAMMQVGTTIEAKPAATDPAPVHVVRVMVVDDNAFVRDVATRYLGTQGLSTVGFASGHAAVEGIRRDPGAFDVALVDLSMPGLNGVETLALLRQTCPDLAAIFTSGYARDEVRSELRAFGDVAFLQKPYQMATLLAAVMDAASARAAR